MQFIYTVSAKKLKFNPTNLFDVMKTTNGSGHEQNVTNLNVEISCVKTFGVQYNPSVTALTIPELNKLYLRGVEANDEAAVNDVAEKSAKAARSNKFDGIDDKVTRIANAVRICGATPQTQDQVESIVRELRAKRATDKLTDEEIAAEKAKGNDVKQVTLHQGTYDRKVINFGKLAQLLVSIPQYKPNEPELTIEAINAAHTEYKTLNDSVVTSSALFEASDIARREVLYADNTGLVDIALAVKQYVKSVFGATSPQYKQISNIPFTRSK